MILMRGNLFTILLKHFNTILFQQLLTWQKKKVLVSIAAELSMVMEFFRLIHINMMSMRLLQTSWIMIGRVFEHGLLPTELGTQHCLLKCHRRAVPLCQTQQMELSHLEDICPLRKAKKDHSNRLFRNTRLLRTIIPFCGTCLITLGILILLL